MLNPLKTFDKAKEDDLGATKGAQKALHRIREMNVLCKGLINNLISVPLHCTPLQQANKFES